jgi:hypothetical protein
VLPSFEIERFRTFSHLVIPRLGRVNLIVGRNGAGKTILLEALRLYASGGDWGALAKILYERDEVIGGQQPVEEGAEPFVRLESLFHGRQPLLGAGNAIRLQAREGDPCALQMELRAFRQTPSKDSLTGYEHTLLDVASLPADPDVLLGMVASVGGRERERILVPSVTKYRFYWERFGHRIWPNLAFVRAGESDVQNMARQWDKIAQADAEDRVYDCLQFLAPVQKIVAVEHPEHRGQRTFVVRLYGNAEAVPLRSLGDGMLRVLQIALALVGAGRPGEMQDDAVGGPTGSEQTLDGICPRMALIDEVENGIHHTVLPELWRFLIKVAKLRDLQVFAATHSWDCVEAFQYAAAKEEDSNAVLIRLEKKGDANRAVTFTDNELAIVTRDGIEVR